MAEVSTLMDNYAKSIHQICKPKQLHIIDLEFRDEFNDYFDLYIK